MDQVLKVVSISFTHIPWPEPVTWLQPNCDGNWELQSSVCSERGNLLGEHIVLPLPNDHGTMY